FAGNLIEQILDPDSDLNTKRHEDQELDSEMGEAVGVNNKLRPFIQKLKSKEPKDQKVESPTKQDDDKSDDQDGGIEQPVNGSPDNAPVSPSTSIVTQSDVEAAESIEKDDQSNTTPPNYDILIGKNSESDQYGLLGE